MMVGFNIDLINQAIKILDEQPKGENRLINIVNNYSPTNVSDKVLRIILSYTDFINRKIWHKDI